MTQESCCPTCGAPLVDQYSFDYERGVFIVDGKSVRFTPAQARLINAIWKYRHRGGIPNLERFAQIAYADLVDGGPDTLNVISIHLSHIRHKLARVGYTVTQNKGRPKSGFRLERIAKKEGAA